MHSPLNLGTLASAEGILKRELLVWEQIVIPHFDSWLPHLHTLANEQGVQGARDLIWLYERSTVLSIDIDFAALAAGDLQRAQAAMGEVFGVPLSQKEAHLSFRKPDLTRGEPAFAHWSDTVARIGAIAARVKGAPDVFPLVSSTNVDPRFGTRLAEAVTLVIERLPIPSDTTPYEAIFDYRRDVVSMRQFDLLRGWLVRMASSDVAAVEAAEQLAGLLADYESHLRLHRMRYRHARLAIAVTAVPALLENLLKLRLSKLADPLLSWRGAQVALLQDELSNPGREVAYIHRTSHHFGAS